VGSCTALFGDSDGGGGNEDKDDKKKIVTVEEKEKASTTKNKENEKTPVPSQETKEGSNIQSKTSPQSQSKSSSAPQPKSQPKPEQQQQPKQACLNIKGNISSSGEKIYHLPGGQFYDRTEPEEIFCTEQEAIAAGYRKSKR
jgi:hypothetical protein